MRVSYHFINTELVIMIMTVINSWKPDTDIHQHRQRSNDDINYRKDCCVWKTQTVINSNNVTEGNNDADRR